MRFNYLTSLGLIRPIAGSSLTHICGAMLEEAIPSQISGKSWWGMLMGPLPGRCGFNLLVSLNISLVSF